MKNQYVGDVGDYGKYSLLRFFGENGIKVGINWYLTENDDSTDGKHITYLKKEEYRRYDPVVFDGMRRLIKENKRLVGAVESLGIIPGAVYYRAILSTTPLPWDERKAVREQWHREAMEALKEVDLVFADPDNGTIGAKSPTSKNAEKFTLPSEIADYYNRGQNVVYYCQKARRSDDKWEIKKTEMTRFLPDARIYILTFHRGTQRSYIFVIHPAFASKYERIIDRFTQGAWGDGGKTAPFERE